MTREEGGGGGTGTIEVGWRHGSVVERRTGEGPHGPAAEHGACDDDGPVQFIWCDEACGVTSRCQIVKIPHNEGCINLLNDRAGPAQWSLCAMKSRGYMRHSGVVYPK